MLLIDLCSWELSLNVSSEFVLWGQSIGETTADNGVLIDLDAGVPTAQWAASSTFHQMTAVALKNDTKIRSMARWSDWVCATFQPSSSEIVTVCGEECAAFFTWDIKDTAKAPTEPTGNATPIRWFSSQKITECWQVVLVSLVHFPSIYKHFTHFWRCKMFVNSHISTVNIVFTSKMYLWGNFNMSKSY